jgi:hypothetical protein
LFSRKQAPADRRERHLVTSKARAFYLLLGLLAESLSMLVKCLIVCSNEGTPCVDECVQADSHWQSGRQKLEDYERPRGFSVPGSSSL